jgi:hypothetical protein
VIVVVVAAAAVLLLLQLLHHHHLWIGMRDINMFFSRAILYPNLSVCVRVILLPILFFIHLNGVGFCPN